MKFSTALLATLTASLTFASPIADALPWANANPQAKAAAQAYADAYAEAVAVGHADPEAFALAASEDDCADITCHMNCGFMIIKGQECSLNEADTYSGPYEDGCLCGTADTEFLSYYDACMDCGWTLWKYYSVYLVPALQQCQVEDAGANVQTEPTGTSRCSTTLSGTYTKDTSIDISTITATISP
jgi:hypothetical protein